MTTSHREYKVVVGKNEDEAVVEWQREINRQYRMGWEFVATLQMPALYGDALYHAVWLFRKSRSGPEQSSEHQEV